MVSRKTKPPLSVTNGVENDGTRLEVFHGNSTEPVVHRDFLDETEAPMWADFTSEATFTYQDNDDEWFHTSHPFHQCSSRQLISAFSYSGEGPSSPKLPPSVSRSRGKDYKSREWGQIKQHPVKNLCGKSSLANSGFGRELKHKSRDEKSKGLASLKTVSDCESGLTEISRPNYFNMMSTFGDSKPHSNYLSLKDSGSSLTRNITSKGSDQQQQKSLEASSQIFGHTSGLLSTLRISLRKSCVTRQASRMETNGGRRSEGCKSSSGKSSVGSSSNPGYDGKNLTLRATQKKEKTPDSRNVTRISQAPKNRGKVTNMCNAPAIQVCETIASKPIDQGTRKAKVQPHTVRAKVLVPQRVNQQDRFTVTKAKDKVGVGRHNRFADGGKENALGRMAVSQKYKTREKATRDTVQAQKSSNWSVPQKSDVKKQEKISSYMEGKKKKPTNVAEKVYLR